MVDHCLPLPSFVCQILKPICGELVELLDGLHEWDFNIFALEPYTKSYLRVITMTCMMELNVLDHIDFDEPKLENFLTEIEKSYNDNPYHNSLHAADVVQTTYHFCTKGRLIDASGMTKISTAALILAASVHDVNHAGALVVCNWLLNTLTGHCHKSQLWIQGDQQESLLFPREASICHHSSLFCISQK